MLRCDFGGNCDSRLGGSLALPVRPLSAVRCPLYPEAPWALRSGFGGCFSSLLGSSLRHVLLVTLVVHSHVRSGSSSTSIVWLIGGVTICLGTIAIWFGLRRILDPLALLTRHVQTDTLGTEVLPLALDGHDELGVLAGAFRQMQRDRARRLDQIQHNNERLQTVLGSMAEGVLAVGADKTILLANKAGR